MKFLIADTHFNHKNIIEYESRPFDTVEQMNESMVYNWNTRVSPGDTVYHLGDVAFGDRGKINEIVSRLNGYKVLIMGNHDRRKSRLFWEYAGFDEVYKNPIVINGITLSHEPVKDIETINICGHKHSRIQGLNPKYYWCVSVENIGYTPILWVGKQ